jgi:hypothetical protein
LLLGDEELSVKLGLLTFTQQLFDRTLPFTMQYMSAVPSAFAVITPEELTDATVASEEYHERDETVALLGLTDKDKLFVSSMSR